MAALPPVAWVRCIHARREDAYISPNLSYFSCTWGFGFPLPSWERDRVRGCRALLEPFIPRPGFFYRSSVFSCFLLRTSRISSTALLPKKFDQLRPSAGRHLLQVIEDKCWLRARGRSRLRGEYLHLCELGEVVPIVGIEIFHVVGEHRRYNMQIKNLLLSSFVFLEERHDFVENI